VKICKVHHHTFMSSYMDHESTTTLSSWRRCGRQALTSELATRAVYVRG